MSWPMKNWLKGTLRSLMSRAGDRRSTPNRRPSRQTVRLRVEALEERTVPSVNLGSNYAGLNFAQSGGFVPPDTVGAAGPTSYVETVNQTIALFKNKATGSPEVTTSLDNFWFNTGRLSRVTATSILSDPIVTYDEQIGRFIIGDQNVDTPNLKSNFDIAVSKTSNPTDLSAANWNFYAVRTTETNYDADYPGNFGYNHDAFFFTLNMFGAVTHVQVDSINAADLAAGVAPGALRTFSTDVGGFSLRPTTMHDAVAGDPMWLVGEDQSFPNTIDVYQLIGGSRSPANLVTVTMLNVAPYSFANNPLNPDGTVITNNMDSRILKSAEANNQIVATHSVAVSGTENDAQWYRIDVSSGTPVLADQGQVSAGNNTYIYYPGIDINAAGDIGMSYMRSGTDFSSDYMSMWITGRKAADPAGTMQASVAVVAGAGKGNYSDFSGMGRAGDMSGINVDPADGTFWVANEYATPVIGAPPNNNWGTAIANFHIDVITGMVPDLGKSTLTAFPAIIASGTTAHIVLQAKDVNGNNIPTGGQIVTMALGASGTGSGTLSAVTDNGNGTYSATFTGTTVGFRNIVATISGVGVVTSSPTVTITIGAFSKTNSVVTVSPGSIASGTVAVVTLQAKDVNGNFFTSGGLNPVFSVIGPGTGSGTFGIVTDNNNGTYSVNFTGTTVGSRHILTTVPPFGSLASSPTVTVTPGAVSTAKSTVSVSPSSIQAGTTATVTLQAEDKAGNFILTGGLTVTFGLGVGNAGGSLSSVTDNGNGTYTATFTGFITGFRVITANISGLGRVTSPLPTITVTPGPIDLNQSVVLLGTALVQAGGTDTVALQAKDFFGNNLTTGGLNNVAFALGGGVGSGTLSSPVIDNGNGTYSVTLTATTVGSNTISAKVGGSPVTSGAPTFTVTSQFEVADFKGNGVWRYSDSTGWRNLSPFDATKVAVDSFGNVVADFAHNGLWRYKDSTGWQNLSPADAALFAVAGDGIVTADFAGNGVWRYDSGGWRNLSGLDANLLSIDVNGDVAANFRGNGVWRFEDATGFVQLDATDATQLSIAGNGFVAADFAGSGLFRFKDSTGWQLLSTFDPNAVVIDPNGNVAANFAGIGVFRYTDASGFQFLTSANAALISIAGNGDVMLGFGSSGVFRFRTGQGLTLLSPFEATSIAINS